MTDPELAALMAAVRARMAAMSATNHSNAVNTHPEEEDSSSDTTQNSLADMASD